MRERYFVVYSGDNFESNSRYTPHDFHMHWYSGAIVEKAMPCPTRRHPQRTKNVYFWVGHTGRALCVHDKSSQMPGYVTEGAVLESNRLYMAAVDAWCGLETPEFRGSSVIRPGIRLLLNQEAALA